jgi:uncharacterized membrane protein YozB (DUF420 family)
MVDSWKRTSVTGGPLRRTLYLLILTAISAFVLYTATKALLAAFWNEDFPESLAVKVELLPLIFPVHMITGALALVLLPLVIALRHRSRWHWPLGRIAAVDVLVAGVTAYPVAWAAPVTFWSAAGFSAQATVWLTLLGLGIYHIRRRRVAAHRACMLLMTATALGAVFFRIFLALWALYGTNRWFEAFYACDAWIAWLLPLGAAALFLARRRRFLLSPAIRG